MLNAVGCRLRVAGGKAIGVKIGFRVLGRISGFSNDG